jgi:hypothetical protein
MLVRTPVHEEARRDPLGSFHRRFRSTELQARRTQAFGPKYQVAEIASDEWIKFWKIIDGPSPGRKLGCKRVNGASSRGKFGCKRVSGTSSR